MLDSRQFEIVISAGKPYHMNGRVLVSIYANGVFVQDLDITRQFLGAIEGLEQIETGY